MVDRTRKRLRAPSREQPELEHAALAFLRRRGYTVLDPERKELHESVGSASTRLVQAASAFGRITDWVQASASIVRLELLTAVFPMFLHLFLALMEEDQPKTARALFADHSDFFLPLHSCSDQYANILGCMRRIRGPIDLEGEDLYQQYQREQRVLVKMSMLARDLLFSRLLSPDMLVLLDIFQRRVTIVDRTKAADTRSAPDGKDLMVRKINERSIQCSVDVANPPMAYGACWHVQNTKYVPHNFSTENIAQKCGLPLQMPNSRARMIASARFTELAANRDKLQKGRLPSIAAYIVDGDGDGISDVNCVEVSSDGKYCAVGTRNVKLWDLEPNFEDVAFDDSRNKDVSVTPESMVLKQQDLQELDLNQPHKQAKAYSCCTLLGHQGRVLNVAFSPDAELLLSTGQDGAVRLWSVPHRHGLCVYTYHSEPIWALDWSPLGHYFVSNGANGESLLWSVERSSPLRVFVPTGNHTSMDVIAWPDVEVIKMHPSSRYVALAAEKNLALWDLSAPSPVRMFSGKNSITTIGFSVDGTRLAAGYSNGSIEFFDLVAGKSQLEVPAAHASPVLALDFSWPSVDSLDSTFLFSGGMDGIVRLQHIDNEEPVVNNCSNGTGHGNSSAASFHVRGYGDHPPPIAAGRFTPGNLLLVACVVQNAGCSTGVR